MQTIIILVLLLLVSLLILGIIVSIRELAGKIWNAARSVWRRILPLIVAGVAGMIALVIAASFSVPSLDPGVVAAVGLAVALAVAIAAYILAGKWFAKNRSSKIYQDADHLKVDLLAGALPTLPVPAFHRLTPKKRLWRQIDNLEELRMQHVLAHLRKMLPEEQSSLDFSQGAIVRFWSRSEATIDTEFIEIRSTLTLWLRESEASLEQTQSMSRAQYLRHCELLVQSLERIAVRSRNLLSARADGEADSLKARAVKVADL